MDIDDQILYDHEGDIRSGQPLTADVKEEEAPKPTTKPSSTIKLSPDNWARVKRLSNKSREIVAIGEHTKQLLKRSQTQNRN